MVEDVEELISSVFQGLFFGVGGLQCLREVECLIINCSHN